MYVYTASKRIDELDCVQDKKVDESSYIFRRYSSFCKLADFWGVYSYFASSFALNFLTVTEASQRERLESDATWLTP